jgi:hypothetical protein
MFNSYRLGSQRYWFKRNKKALLIIEKDFSRCFTAVIPGRITEINQTVISNTGWFWSLQTLLDGERTERVKQALDILKLRTSQIQD